jgi:hypothetical protein
MGDNSVLDVDGVLQIPQYAVAIERRIVIATWIIAVETAMP